MANKYERASQWVKKNEDKLSGNKAEAAAGKKTGSGKSGGYQSAKEWVSQRGSDVSGREAAANNVRNWLSRVNSAYSGMQQYEKDNGNRWDKNYGGQWYEQLLEAKRDYESIGPKAKTLGLDYSDVYADLKKMTRGIQQSREYMSQFDSEEAYQTAIRPSLWYQKYQGMDEKGLETVASQTQDKEEKAFIQSMAANARMERLRNLDETMTQTEIGRLKRQRDERMDAASEDWTDAASREKARQAAKEEKQYNARIAQLETEITQARRAKQAQALGGVGDRTSEHYDPTFREGSQYRGDDMVSRIINETEQERAWRKQQDDTWGESVYSQRGYDRLSQQEKDTYNYWAGYDSRNGTQKAQEYLDSMQETLNARIAEDRYGDIADENRLMKLAFYTATGLEGAMEGIGKSLDFLTGKEEYTPASASAIAASMLLQDDRENGTKVWKVLQDEEGGRTWEEFLGQSAMSIGNMVPSMATAFALNTLLPGLGLAGKLGSGLSKAGSLGVMGAGIAGNTYAEAINQGYSPENAKAYAMANAASEIGTELLFGGIEGMTGIGTEAMTDALLKKTDNAILRYLTRVGTDGLGEAMEEGVQAIIEPWMNSVTLHTDEALRGEDVAYNMLAGFSTGAIMSAPMIGAEEYGTYRAGKNALANGLNVDALQKVTGSFDADTEAARLSKKIGSSTGAYTIGRALREVDAGLSEQNIRDISGYLQSKNLPENVAEHNARLLNYVAMGGELSQRDVKVLEADKLLADAFREVVLKQDSTVNQRIQGARNLFGKAENTSAQSRAKAGNAQTRASQKGDSVLTDPNRAVLAVDSREGDTMQLRLKDGRVVDSSEAGAYHDENEAVLFDTARRYSADTAGANRIVNGFAGSGLSLEEYSKGIADSYRYGQYGMNYSQVKEGSLSSQVDGDAAYDAYLAGMRWAASQYAKAQKAAMETRQPNQAAQLHFQRKGRTFDGKRESALAMMDTLSKALGENFWVFESYEKNGKRVYADETGAEHAAPNGFYDKNGVHIDLNAGNDGRGVMLYTLGHELTHYIRQNSPEKFKAFADLIMESFGNRGVSADALIQEQIAKAVRNGRNISYETAYEEMIADSMETILADGKALERLGQIQQKEPSLGQTIRQWAKDTAEKIRAVVNAYKGEKADSLEGRITAQLEQVLPELEELYAEGLADASGTGKATNGESMKKAIPEDGKRFSLRDVEIERQYIDFNNKSKRDTAEKETVASLIERGKVTVIPKGSIAENLLDINWDDGKEARKAIKNVLKPFLGVTVEFTYNGENATAYLTKAGSNHTLAGANTFEKGAALSAYYSLIQNAEYSYSGHPDHSTVSLNTDWDYFVSVAEVDGTTVPLVFAIRSVDFETRSQIYSIATKRNPGNTHDRVNQKTDGALPNYGELPDSKAMVSHAEESVNTKLSDRDPEAVKRNQILEKQNEDLKDTVQYLKELVKLQGKVTDGTVYSRNSVEWAGKQMMKEAGAKGDIRELTGILEKTYRAMGEGSEDMTQLIDEAAGWLAEHRRTEGPKLDSYAEGILKDMKGRSIALNESQKAEAEALLGSYGDYRRRFFGSVNLSDKANTSLDQFWTEMSEIYPDIFRKDVSSADMPRELYQAVDTLRNLYEENGGNPEEAEAAFLNEQRMKVWESFSTLKPIRTVADKNQAKVEAIKERYNAKLRDIQSRYESQRQELKTQRQADLQAVRERLQAKAESTQAAARERYRQQREDLNAARQDIQTMEQEFLRIAREYDKAGRAGNAAQEAAEEFQNALKAEIRKHKQDNAVWQAEFKRLSREYEAMGRNAQRLQIQLERNRAAAQARTESRKQTAVRNQIQDIHGKLRKMLLHPQKSVTGHAPTALTKAVAEVCDLFTANLEQAGLRRMGEYDSRIEALDGKLREKPELKYAQNGVEAANRQKERIAKTAEKLNALRETYAKIQQDSRLGIYYDAHTASLLEAVTRELSGKDIYEMDSRELTQVKNAMASFYHAIVNANKIQLGAREAGLIETAAKWGQEISDVNSGFLSKYLGRYFHYQMSPDTFFAATSGFAKDNTGSEVQKMFQRGTERSLEVQREYYNLFSDITENKQYRKELRALLDNPTGGMVDVGLRNEKGESMKITRGMAMQLYMLLGQKDSFEALVYSGLKAPNMRMYYRDRSRAYGGQDIRQMYTTKLGDEAFRLSRELEAGEKALRKKDYGGMTESQLRSHLEEIRTQRDELVMGEEARLSQIRENIENLLTPMEKEAITLGRQWYRRSGQLMADAHEQTRGYRPGLVEDYVPVHRDGTTVWTDIRESDGAFNLENSGFLQERTENRNAVLLTDFFTELGSQRDAIARYYGYVQAQKDFNRLWKTRLPGVGRSINSMIAAKFGTGNTGLGISGVDYVENYIKDIGGGRDKSGGLFSLFYGASASATLSLNPRVAVSQLASIPTAAAVVGWKNMGVGFWKGLGTALSTEKMNDLAQKNVYFFQRYRGNGGITEIADMQTGSGMWQKIARSKGGKALLNWCQNMDVFATSTMYAMAEEAVKSRGMKSGDGGFEKAVNEMYTDIIRKTQPNYTITERSEMLRDSRAGAKIFSMYKTQPNQNLNILMQAAGTLSKVSRDFKAGVGSVTAADVRRAKTDFVNAGTAVVVGGNLMFVLVRTGVNLIMGQVAGYRDDETNEVTSDAVLEGMFKEFLSSMSGMFLLGGQAYDILNSTVSGESYYGLSDNAIKTVGDLTEKSVKLFQKIKEGGAEFGDYEKTAGALLTAMGVPYSNAKRFVEAYRHWAQNLEKGSLWNYSEEYTTGANYRNRFLEAYRAGDQEGCGNSLAALAALSDAPNQRRIASEVRSGFQSSFREKFLQGEITADEVKDIFANYLDAEPEDTERMIAGWKGQLETGFTLDAYQDRYLKGEIGTEDYIRYLTEYQGKERQEAEKAELWLRCERDTGYAYDELKETYLDGDITASQAERWMAGYGQEEEPQKKRKEYDFEKETGYAWADRRDAFLSGGVSGEQMKKWLADIEGRRDYDADNYLRDLEFERDNGFAYNQKLEQYVAGKISREQLKKVLTTRGNMYDAEADREIVAYDYIKNHPDTKLGLSTAYSYTRKIDKWDYTIETSGITEEQFLSFRDQKAACNGTDNDGDGRRDSGSVQAQILPIINAMPITEEQKDTLWYFCGWSSRTLKRKAPWKK